MPKTIEGVTHIYRISWFQRAFAIVFTAMGIFFGAAFWEGSIEATREASFIELIIPPVFVICGVLLTMRAFRNYIALSQSEIAQQSIVGRRSLPFNKIRPRRRYLSGGTGESPSVWYLKLEPNDDRFSEIEFEESDYNLNEAFYNWFKAVPDLDGIDKTRPKPSNFGLV